MSIKITHPEGLTGNAIGLDFVAGVAEVESLSDAARTVIAEHGYTVEGKATPPEVTIPEGEPTGDWNVPQLKAYAESKSIDLGDAKKKDEILAVLTAAAKAAADKAAAESGNTPGAE